MHAQNLSRGSFWEVSKKAHSSVMFIAERIHILHIV